MRADLPQILPDGQTLWIDADFMDKLHNGAPEVGWIGDDRLGVYYGSDCMELRRLDQHGNARLIMRSRPGLRHLGMETIVFLAEHDPQSRRAYNLVDDINDHNDRVRRDRDARQADRDAEALDRLAHALLRDAGAYENGVTRQYYGGIDVPKRKKGRR